MKTTFKDLFLDFDDDLIGIEEESVFVNTDINEESVMKIALSRSAKKKPFSKSIKVLMIAAAITITMGICSSVILANSEVRNTFREFFGGSMESAGIYDGGDVRIKTDDPNLDIEFSGVSGDGYEVYAVMTAKKKDGSTFTDEDYLYPITATKSEASKKYLESLKGSKEFDQNMLLSDLADFMGIQATVRDNDGNNFGYGDSGSAMIQAKYYLSSDRKNMKILVRLDEESSGTKHLDSLDGTMTIKSICFTAQKNIRTIMTSDGSDPDSHDRYLKKIEELDIDKSDCAILHTENENIYCQVDRKTYPLGFEVTFDMNYRYKNNIEMELEPSDAPHFIEKNSRDIRMTISPFSVRLKAEKDYDGSMVVFYPVDVDSSKFIMKDGTEYYLLVSEGAGSGGSAKGYIKDSLKISFVSSDPLSGLEKELNIIDTKEISKLIINDDVIYDAG